MEAAPEARGAFIDQMATLLGVAGGELNELSKGHERTYTIASRCGVFAKSDIQPLLNQGAKKSDIAASIFGAVVNQTIAGLAQGRPIQGQVLYLGGPLTFLSELRRSFDDALGLTGVCPEGSLYYVALGAAYCAEETVSLDEFERRLKRDGGAGNLMRMEPLFRDEEEYQAFVERHGRAKAPRKDFAQYEGGVVLGVDAGSTTVKFALISEEGALLHLPVSEQQRQPRAAGTELSSGALRPAAQPAISGVCSDGIRRGPHPECLPDGLRHC